jgi:hypothetical protein
MDNQPDPELQQWMADWQAPGPQSTTTPEAIHRFARGRGRLIRMLVAGELVIVLALLPVMIATGARGSWFDRVAMMLLAAASVAAIGFSWWNWHGTLRATSESTAAFLALSRLRTMRLQRAIVAGWCLLAAEVAVFVPWVAYRLYGRGPAADGGVQVFAWALLVGLAALGAGWLVALRRWSISERDKLDVIQEELDA